MKEHYHYLDAPADVGDHEVFYLPALCGRRGWKVAGDKREQVNCPDCLKELDALSPTGPTMTSAEYKAIWDSCVCSGSQKPTSRTYSMLKAGYDALLKLESMR